MPFVLLLCSAAAAARQGSGREAVASVAAERRRWRWRLGDEEEEEEEQEVEQELDDEPASAVDSDIRGTALRVFAGRGGVIGLWLCAETRDRVGRGREGSLERMDFVL